MAATQVAAAQDGKRTLSPDELSFETLVRFFESCRKLKGGARGGKGDKREQHVK
jgi:hypothetical protein